MFGGIGDTITDLAVANEDDGTVWILTGNGDGGFVEEPIVVFTGGLAPLALDPSDIDNDKCPDLVGINNIFAFAKDGAGAGPGSIFVLHNSNGVFDSVDNYPIGNNPTDLAVGDLDHDGLPDIAAVNSDDDTVSLLRNVTGSDFVAAGTLAVGVGPVSIDAVDLDGDGDADLAVVANAVVQVLENLGTMPGDLVFGEPEEFDVVDDPQFVVSGDFNGDGVADLVTVNENLKGGDTGSVTVLLSDPLVLEIVGCLTITGLDIVCNGDGSTFTFTVQGINSCTGGLESFTFTASGGAVGEPICFTLVVASGGFCCTAELCATIPDCTPAAGPCDLDGDGVVGVLDFLALLDAWGPCADCSPQSCPADFDGDCDVGIADFLTLLAHWG